MGIEASPVEEGCNYFNGASDEHPLFILAERLQLPSAVCPADLGGRFGGWESCDVAEWHDAENHGEEIPLAEVIEAFFLLEQTLHGIGYLTNSSEPGDSYAKAE